MSRPIRLMPCPRPRCACSRSGARARWVAASSGRPCRPSSPPTTRAEPIEAIVAETRPGFEGSRIAAWELREAGVPHVVVTDAAAPGRIAAGDVDAVLVSADRVLAGGDVIAIAGTYPLALAASAAGDPVHRVRRLDRRGRGARRRPGQPRGGPVGTGDVGRRHARRARGDDRAQPGPGPDARGPRHDVGHRAAGRAARKRCRSPRLPRLPARAGRLRLRPRPSADGDDRGRRSAARSRHARRPTARCCARTSSRIACSRRTRSATSRTASSGARSGGSRPRATRSSPSGSSTAASRRSRCS